MRSELRSLRNQDLKSAKTHSNLTKIRMVSQFNVFWCLSLFWSVLVVFSGVNQ